MRVTIKGVGSQQGSMVPSVINMSTTVSDYFFTGETARWKDHMGETALSRGAARCKVSSDQAQ